LSISRFLSKAGYGKWNFFTGSNRKFNAASQFIVQKLYPLGVFFARHFNQMLIIPFVKFGILNN